MKSVNIFLILSCFLTAASIHTKELSSSGVSVSPVNKNIKEDVLAGWRDFHTVVGKCSLKFPVAPEHFSEKMKSPGGEGYEVHYDAYISAHEQKSVYMLLIAEYPQELASAPAQISLDGFLNGLLSNNPSNQLLYADFLLVEGGHQALDFFIRTGGVYCKGRAIMHKNQLYLLAMECEVQNYNERVYNYFLSSFKFK